MLYFVCVVFVWFSLQTVIIVIITSNINQLRFVTVKCGVFFEVQTEFLHVTRRTVGFKGLRNLLNVSSSTGYQ
jgi:hypothetical protein